MASRTLVWGVARSPQFDVDGAMPWGSTLVRARGGELLSESDVAAEADGLFNHAGFSARRCNCSQPVWGSLPGVGVING